MAFPRSSSPAPAGPSAPGFSLALACDFRVLDEAATFRQAYTSAGLSIDGGATFMLPRLAGLARALEIAAFDEPIDAVHAASAGLATRIAAAGAALDGARALARELQACSLASFASSKRLLRRSSETPLEVQLEHERAAIVACARTAEGTEGISAFEVRAYIRDRGALYGTASAIEATIAEYIDAGCGGFMVFCKTAPAAESLEQLASVSLRHREPGCGAVDPALLSSGGCSEL